MEEQPEVLDHYVLEDPLGGCRGIKSGCLIGAAIVLVIIAIVVGPWLGL